MKTTTFKITQRPFSRLIKKNQLLYDNISGSGTESLTFVIIFPGKSDILRKLAASSAPPRLCAVRAINLGDIQFTSQLSSSLCKKLEVLEISSRRCVVSLKRIRGFSVLSPQITGVNEND